VKLLARARLPVVTLSVRGVALLAVALLAAGAMPLSAQAPAAGAPAATAGKGWVALNSQQWPPYYVDDPSHPGFARELLQTCVTALGYEPRFSSLTIDKMYDALRSGVLDAHVLSPDKSRQAFMVYGKTPLFSDAYRPTVRSTSGITIKSLADFDRLKIGHLRGLRYSEAYHDYVLKRIDAGTVVQADTNDQLLSMLLDGTIDVFVNVASTTRWLARERHVGDRVLVLSYDVKSADYFLALSQKSRIEDKPGFLAAFDGCVQQVRRDGRYAKLRATYGLE
jgi:polar amino acid transport system substrate-binding protein